MRKFSRKLFAILLMLAVFVSTMAIDGAGRVNAISVSDDVIRFIEAAQNLTNDNRVAIVELIADEDNGYALRSDYDTNLEDNAEAIYAIISEDAEEEISVDTIERGLIEFKEYYEESDTNEFFVKYALSNLVEGLTDYDTSGYSFDSIEGNIADYTLTFDIFMNFMSHIKTLTGLTPLISNAAGTNLTYNTQLDVYLDLAAVLSDIDYERIEAYKNRLIDLIEVVNDYSDTSERDEFILYLIDNDLVTVSSDDDDDDSVSGGGGGGSTTPVSEPASETPTITTTPVIDPDTGTAESSITQTAITEALSNAVPVTEGVKEATIEVSAVTGAVSYAVELPSEVLNTSELNHTIEIVTEIASVELPSNMITGTAVDNKVELVIGKADTAQLPEAIKAQIGSKPVIELDMLTNGRQVNWSNPDAPVTVSVDYTPTSDELKYPENIVVWYIDGSNNIVSVPSGRYDPVTGKVTFKADHFSKYAVAFSYKTFTDLSSHIWAKRQIEVMASKGIVSGISTGKYNPGDNVTRGDYLKSLVNALGLSARYEGNFNDVKESDAYYKEIAVAKKLGITVGIGNNKFAPEAAITRQDMMVLTAKALSAVKQIDFTDSTLELNNFNDQSGIAAYARSSVAAMVRSGLIKGDGKNINPHANTSRAEAAVIMYRIYNK